MAFGEREPTGRMCSAYVVNSAIKWEMYLEKDMFAYLDDCQFCILAINRFKKKRNFTVVKYNLPHDGIEVLRSISKLIQLQERERHDHRT